MFLFGSEVHVCKDEISKIYISYISSRCVLLGSFYLGLDLTIFGMILVSGPVVSIQWNVRRSWGLLKKNVRINAQS